MKARGILLALSLGILFTVGGPPRPTSQASVLTLGGNVPVGWTLATAYSTVAAAIDATPSGGTLYFPATGGPYTPPDSTGWTINKPMTVRGDGFGQTEVTAFLFYDNATTTRTINSKIFTLGTSAQNVTFQDFCISSTYGQPAVTTGTGDGISYTSTTSQIGNLAIRNVQILYAGRSAIRLTPTAPGYVVGLVLDRVTARYCGGTGIYLTYCTGTSLYGCYAQHNLLNGIYASNSDGISMFGTTAESNLFSGTNNNNQAQIALSNCKPFTIMGGHIEEYCHDSTSTCRTGIAIEVCRSGYIGGMTMSPTTTDNDTRAIYLTTSSQNVVIGPNAHQSADICVEIAADGTSTGNVVMPQSLVGGSGNSATARGRVIIPDNQYNAAFVVGIPDSLGYANNRVVGLLLPAVRAAGTLNAPHANEVGTAASILQRGLLVFTKVDSLLLRGASTWRAF